MLTHGLVVPLDIAGRDKGLVGLAQEAAFADASANAGARLLIRGLINFLRRSLIGALLGSLLGWI